MTTHADAPFPAQPRRQALGIAGVRDQLQLSICRIDQLDGGCECAAVPPRCVVIRNGKLRGRPVVAQRDAAKPVIRKQACAARELGENVGGKE